jgi:hypothetical protein
MGREYSAIEFCGNCQVDTPHLVHSAGHERDSSHDWQKCLVCNWKLRGVTDKYEPPFEE